LIRNARTQLRKSALIDAGISKDSIYNLFGDGFQVRFSDPLLGFYNQNIDALAEPCPICEELGPELANLEESELIWFESHMEKEHGLVK